MLVSMGQSIKDVLNRILTWPDVDQEELAEVARDIEARRSSVYVLNDDEKAALDAARRTGIASDAHVAALWKRHGAA
jgi:hypothetical protein